MDKFVAAVFHVTNYTLSPTNIFIFPNVFENNFED